MADSCEYSTEHSGSIKDRKFFDYMNTVSFSTRLYFTELLTHLFIRFLAEAEFFSSLRPHSLLPNQWTFSRDT